MMNALARLPVLILGLVVLAACGQAESESGAQPADESTGAQSMNCPVIDSRNWEAWINAMPGPDAQRTLIVVGEVDLPTPGFDVNVTPGRADRSAVPTQHAILSATPPDGVVAQVVTSYPVRLETPAIADNYTAVIVRCGDDVLAEITEIVVAQ